MNERYLIVDEEQGVHVGLLGGGLGGNTNNDTLQKSLNFPVNFMERFTLGQEQASPSLIQVSICPVEQWICLSSLAP